MTDREKVIKGLECCNTPNNHEECPYNGAEHYNICTHQLLNDAIKLLKAQEPVEPVQDMVGDALFWVCGSCGHDVSSSDWYCANCGRAVKWE